MRMMTDWSALGHAYGEATDIPDILEILRPDGWSESWNDLWSRICHQGTVYSASYAALPYLRDLAARWEPRQREMPIMLAGAIVASRDVFGMKRPERIGEFADLLREFYRLTLEAAVAFEQESVWGRHLNGVSDGELPGACPRCKAQLHLVVGKYGFFAAAGEWLDKPHTKRTPIRPAASERLRPVGRWLADQASSTKHEELANWIRYLFGSTECPACGAPISVEEAVVALEESVKPRLMPSKWW